MDESTAVSTGRVGTRAGRVTGASPQLMIVLGALALTALLYWQTSVEIADFWQDTARRRYTHGWAVLAVTVWLVWRQRGVLRDIPLRPVPGGWLLVVAGSIAWLIAFHAALLVPTMLVLPALALSAVFAVGGWGLARQVAFPLLFLYFALPIWDVIDLPLQTLTAKISLWLVQLVGIPATTDGHVIHIPAGWFEIAASCNGLHFLIVALAIAAVHGHVDGDDWGSGLMLLVLAAGLAVLTNLLRVFIVIVAGHLTDMQHFLVQVDHYYFGWVLFAFTLVGYVYIAGRLPRRARASREEATIPTDETRGRVNVAAVLTITALATGPAWSRIPPHDSTAAVPPKAVAGWSGPVASVGDWRPVFANPDEELLVDYPGDPAVRVTVYRAIYRSQRQNKELGGYGNTVVGAHYRELESEALNVRAGSGTMPVVERLIEGGDGSLRLVWSLFAVDGEPTTMRSRDRVAYGVRSLFGPPPASVVALSAECNPECDRARDALKTFAADALPALLDDPLAESR